MSRGLMSAVVVLCVVGSAWGQRAVAIDNRKADEVVRLWEGEAPGAIGDGDRDIPTLSVFRPEEGKANGAAVVIRIERPPLLELPVVVVMQKQILAFAQVVDRARAARM